MKTEIDKGVQNVLNLARNCLRYVEKSLEMSHRLDGTSKETVLHDTKDFYA